MKVFIAGPRAIKELDNNIRIKINSICDKNYDVLVGDADGIDTSVQKHLQNRAYRNVRIFASKGLARNNIGNWNVENVEVNDDVKGFDFYAQKDLEMAKKADVGFMIWNGKSRGTFNNMINLLKLEKEVVLYYVPTEKFYSFKQIIELEEFINLNVKLDSKLKKLMPAKQTTQFIQACLF